MTYEQKEIQLINTRRSVNSSQRQSTPAYHPHSSQKASAARARKLQKARRQRAAARLFLLSSIAVLLLCILVLWNDLPMFIFDNTGTETGEKMTHILFSESKSTAAIPDNMENTASASYLDELEELLSKNEEAREFVEDYPDRQAYIGQPIDLSPDFMSGEVPLLMQWDKRWGYDSMGESIIGLAGCGPTCLSMAYLYFTGDLSGTPREMADYCVSNGYYAGEGTSWSLWTDGLKEWGLYGKELSLSENSMKAVLDNGSLIVCSMRPGDFTTTGHYILIRGYDENGFYVNDPNRRSNSSRQWDYDTLSYQIKNLWAVSKL